LSQSKGELVSVNGDLCVWVEGDLVRLCTNPSPLLASLCWGGIPSKEEEDVHHVIGNENLANLFGIPLMLRREEQGRKAGWTHPQGCPGHQRRMTCVLI
jgi:hypothetical protein